MLKSVVGVYNTNKNDWEPAAPKVYNNNSWQPTIAYVYDTEWKTVGGIGALYTYFIEKNGNNYNSTENILVKELDERDRWIDKNGAIMNCRSIVGDSASPSMKFILVPSEIYFNVLRDSNNNILKDTRNTNLHTTLMARRV